MTAPKPRRRTIRFAIVAVVCLLLGAVTTVGVAWTIVLRTDWIGLAQRQQRAAEASAVKANPDEVRLVTQFYLLGLETELIGSGIHWASERLSPDGVCYPCPNLQAGWPALAVDSEAPGGAERNPWQFVSWRAGVSAPSTPRGSYHEYLPVMPLFPGFALDTALYAAAWYLLIFTPLPLIRAGRRRFRVSRGMCGSCGYDLNASTNRPCPECGNPPRGEASP